MTSLSPLDSMAAARPVGTAWLSGATLMFMLCFCGMATGLAIDLQSILPATLISLCLGAHSIARTVVLHATVLPATNLLMLAGGVLAIGLIEAPASDAARRRPVGARIGFYLVCNGAMLAGMLGGAAFGPTLMTRFALPWTLPAMMIAMATGMGLGMATVIGLRRVAAALRLALGGRQA